MPLPDRNRLREYAVKGGHLAARQLGVEVIELFPRAVGAQQIVAAAKGQTPHRREVGS